MQSLIYVSNRHFFTNSNTEIHCRYVDGRHPYRNRLELAGEVGEDSLQPLCQLGVNRDDGLAGSTGSTQVTVVGIDDLLIMHGRMNCRNSTTIYLEFSMQCFDDRDHAVGGTGGVGDDPLAPGARLYDTGDVAKWESEFLTFMRDEKSEVRKQLVDEKKLSDEIDGKLNGCCQEFSTRWQTVIAKK